MTPTPRPAPLLTRRPSPAPTRSQLEAEGWVLFTTARHPGTRRPLLVFKRDGATRTLAV